MSVTCGVLFLCVRDGMSIAQRRVLGANRGQFAEYLVVSLAVAAVALCRIVHAAQAFDLATRAS